MRRSVIVAMLAIVLPVVTRAAVEEDARPVLVVFPSATDARLSPLVARISSALGDSLAARVGGRIIGAASADSILTTRGFRRDGCVSPDCLERAANMLESACVVATDIASRRDGIYVESRAWLANPGTEVRSAVRAGYSTPEIADVASRDIARRLEEARHPGTSGRHEGLWIAGEVVGGQAMGFAAATPVTIVVAIVALPYAVAHMDSDKPTTGPWKTFGQYAGYSMVAAYQLGLPAGVCIVGRWGNKNGSVGATLASSWLTSAAIDATVLATDAHGGTLGFLAATAPLAVATVVYNITRTKGAPAADGGLDVSAVPVRTRIDPVTGDARNEVVLVNARF